MHNFWNQTKSNTNEQHVGKKDQQKMKSKAENLKTETKVTEKRRPSKKKLHIYLQLTMSIPEAIEVK